jgi:exopolyphosphatase/pppGpp-phosphohydrolase
MKSWYLARVYLPANDTPCMRAELLAEVDGFVAKFEPEPAHVRQVARLADALYTDLSKWHRYRQRERELLQAAALLHDIGWSASPTGQNHHKHSAKMIRQFPWIHLSLIEVGLVALIARYHRKALPCREHKPFREMSSAQQRLVCMLAAILRVADALDRSHTSAVQEVEAQLDHDEIIIAVHSRTSATAEFAALQKKKDLLEKTSGRPVIARQGAISGSLLASAKL